MNCFIMIKDKTEPRPSNAKGSAAKLCSSIKSLTATEARRIINNDSIKNKRLLFWGTKQLLLRKESSKCLFESCGEEEVQLRALVTVASEIGRPG
ncbi:unnamed protein product [Gadus morhua 'NCC']